MGATGSWNIDIPGHHTRLPGYARGRTGVVARVLGTHVFADSHAHGNGERPQWLYTVAFDAATLWPDAASDSAQTARGPAFTVSVDAWEPYLQAADDIAGGA
jgi:nitrile hydratase